MNLHEIFSRFAFASCVGVAGTAVAAPVVVDFANYASTGVHAAVASNGFTFVPTAGSIAVAANGTNCAPTCAANGSTTLVVGGVGLNPPTIAPVTMSSALYSSFRLTGLDYAELSESAATGFSASTIVMTGSLLGGGNVSQTLTIDGLNDGPGGAPDFQSAPARCILGRERFGIAAIRRIHRQLAEQGIPARQHRPGSDASRPGTGTRDTGAGELGTGCGLANAANAFAPESAASLSLHPCPGRLADMS